MCTPIEYTAPRFLATNQHADRFIRIYTADGREQHMRVSMNDSTNRYISLRRGVYSMVLL